MNKITCKELKEIANKNNVNSVEFVKYSSSKHSLHTDNIDWLDWDLEKMSDEKVVYYHDYHIMNAEEYNRTLYANCCEYADDDYMPVMVVVVEPATYRIVFDTDTDSMSDSVIFDSLDDAISGIKNSSYYDDYIGGTATVVCEQDEEKVSLYEEEVGGIEYFENKADNNYDKINDEYNRVAFVGFETFEEAEEVAEKYGLEICEFTKDDGDRVWRNRGHVYNPYDMKKKFANYIIFTTDDEEDFYENEIKEQLGDFDSLEDLKKFIEYKEGILEKIRLAGDDELVIVNGASGDYYDTVSRYTMSYYYDTHSYAIGVC